MKHLMKLIALVAIFGLVAITYSGELGVENIDVIDAHTISVTLSENPNLEIGTIEGEVRVLNDLSLRGGFASEENSNQVELMLEDSLMANTNYSLLTVSGAEGSIDFATPSELEGFSGNNILSTDTQDIDTIEIVDDRTILVTYREDLTESIFEYKLLAESEVVAVEKPDYFLPELLISVEPTLIGEKDYILMFIEIQDVEGNYLEFDTGIYDFMTPELAASEIIDESMLEEVSNEEEEVTIEEPIEVATPEEENPSTEIMDEEASIETDELDVDLEAAGDDTSLEKSGESEIDVNDVAESADQTPDTGAQTWVLVLLTIVINSFYYLSRRKKLVQA